jgi:hypothetical protein
MQSLRSIGWIEARQMKATASRVGFLRSLASRRQRPKQASVRPTTQRVVARGEDLPTATVGGCCPPLPRSGGEWDRAKARWGGRGCPLTGNAISASKNLRKIRIDAMIDFKMKHPRTIHAVRGCRPSAVDSQAKGRRAALWDPPMGSPRTAGAEVAGSLQ